MKKFGKFFGLGIIAVLIEFIVFSIIARILSNDFLWAATIVGGITETITAYLLNTKFVWKKRGKKEATNFFLYHILKTFTLKEFFTWVFGLITPVYEFAYGISSFLHLPFDYDFVESTGIFGFTAATTMVITYFVCDRLIFAEKADKSRAEEDKREEHSEDRKKTLEK